MSDRLSLAHAIEAAGIPRDKAEGMATAIVQFVEGGVATKAQLDAAKAELKADIAALDSKIGRQDVAIERVRSAVRETESRLWARIGGAIAAAVAILVALQHLWPPH